LNALRRGVGALVLAIPLSVSAQQAPIIDMHLHALGANDQGPAPVAVCAPFPAFPAWDQRQPYIEGFLGMLKNPACEDPVWSPTTDDALRDETIGALETLNVFGVLSGPTERVLAWQQAAPGRFLAGLGFSAGPTDPSPDSIRALVEGGALEVLAEVTTQYLGIAPSDEIMAPYWALAEELDLPVGIHMGPGPPGGIYIGQTAYRASLSSALLLEDVLVRHPGLRVYVMHAGYPLLDDMLALLYAHPQVHVEVGSGWPSSWTAAVCDETFIREEMTWVDYVRDREVADVHVLVTQEQTGAGGQAQTFDLIGRGPFLGMDYSAVYVTRAGATDAERGQGSFARSRRFWFRT
jgi:uncharacterized protein